MQQHWHGKASVSKVSYWKTCLSSCIKLLMRPVSTKSMCSKLFTRNALTFAFQDCLSKSSTLTTPYCHLGLGRRHHFGKKDMFAFKALVSTSKAASFCASLASVAGITSNSDNTELCNAHVHAVATADNKTATLVRCNADYTVKSARQRNHALGLLCHWNSIKRPCTQANNACDA